MATQPAAKPTTTKPAAKPAGKPAPKREVITAQEQMDDAPSRGKWATYFKLPEGVKRFAPKDDHVYRLIFLPWHPGKMHPRFGKSNWVTNFFFAIHQGIGPNDEKFCCPASMQNKPCPVCEEFQLRRSRLARDDKKGYDAIKDLRAKNRELSFVHDLDGPRNNLFIWDESTFLFGDHLRERMTMKEKYKAYADFSEGLIVCVKGKKESTGPGGGDFVKFATIEFEDRDEPLSDFLIAAAGKYKIDEAVFMTPYEKVKEKLSRTGGMPDVQEEPPASEEEQEVAEPAVDEEPVVEDLPVEQEPEAEETVEEEVEAAEPEAEETVEEEVEEEVQEEPEEVEEEVEEIVEEPVEEEVAEEPPPPPVRKPAPKPAAPAAKPAAKPATTAAKPAAKPATAPAKKPAGK